jgi:hypothetical protein
MSVSCPLKKIIPIYVIQTEVPRTQEQKIYQV